MGADSSHGNTWHWDDWDDSAPTYSDTDTSYDEHYEGYPKDPIEISSDDEEAAAPPMKKARTGTGDDDAGWGAFPGYDSYERFHHNWKRY